MSLVHTPKPLVIGLPHVNATPCGPPRLPAARGGIAVAERHANDLGGSVLRRRVLAQHPPVASRPGRSNLCPHDPPKCDLTASDASGVVGFGYTSIPVRSRKCGITADRAFVFVPRGRPHTFQSVGDEPARILIHFTHRGSSASSRVSQRSRRPAPDFREGRCGGGNGRGRTAARAIGSHLARGNAHAPRPARGRECYRRPTGRTAVRPK